MSREQVRTEQEVHELVRERYAEVARSGGIGPGGSCCGPSPADIATRLGYKTEDTCAVPQGANLGVGCGAPLAAAGLRAGETVLDLGSGAGFDAFLAARDVGPSGRVIGVDMTDEMLAKACDNAKSAGLPNVEFRKGYIENLPVEDDSIDVVISNCVINLVADKEAVYREIARVLRPGGRMVISDVVLDAPLPAVVADDVAALTGCIAGAALRADYLAVIQRAGLIDVEVVTDTGFGEVALTMIPQSMLRMAQAAGVDVAATAESVRSLTLRAHKPATASGS